MTFYNTHNKTKTFEELMLKGFLCFYGNII